MTAKHFCVALSGRLPRIRTPLLRADARPRHPYASHRRAPPLGLLHEARAKGQSREAGARRRRTERNCRHMGVATAPTYPALCRQGLRAGRPSTYSSGAVRKRRAGTLAPALWLEKASVRAMQSGIQRAELPNTGLVFCSPKPCWSDHPASCRPRGWPPTSRWLMTYSIRPP